MLSATAKIEFNSLLNGPVAQLPAATKFKSGCGKSAQQRPDFGLEMCNLRRSRFCDIVSSNLPRIESPR
jgi:hypothetical protein